MLKNVLAVFYVEIKITSVNTRQSHGFRIKYIRLDRNAMFSSEN